MANYLKHKNLVLGTRLLQSLRKILIKLVDLITPFQVGNECNNTKYCQNNNSISYTFINVETDKRRFFHDITFLKV